MVNDVSIHASILPPKLATIGVCVLLCHVRFSLWCEPPMKDQLTVHFLTVCPKNDSPKPRNMFKLPDMLITPLFDMDSTTIAIFYNMFSKPTLFSTYLC